ncbi:hypothetical protein ACC668_02825 [Rhizobium ruizarguesonis]
MEQHKISINFPGESSDRANLLAESLAVELSREVQDEGKPVRPDIQRTDPAALDFGATIALVLGTPAIIVLANAVRDWARRTDNSTVNINGVLIEHLQSADVADIIRAVKGEKKSE